MDGSGDRRRSNRSRWTTNLSIQVVSTTAGCMWTAKSVKMRFKHCVSSFMPTAFPASTKYEPTTPRVEQVCGRGDLCTKLKRNLKLMSPVHDVRLHEQMFYRTLPLRLHGAQYFQTGQDVRMRGGTFKRCRYITRPKGGVCEYRACRVQSTAECGRVVTMVQWWTTATVPLGFTAWVDCCAAQALTMQLPTNWQTGGKAMVIGSSTRAAGRDSIAFLISRSPLPPLFLIAQHPIRLLLLSLSMTHFRVQLPRSNR